MRLIYKIFIMANFFFLLCISGCNKAVKVDSPITGLSGTAVYSSDATAAAAVTGIYDRMIQGEGLSSGLSSISFRQGLSADELKAYYTNDEILNQFYKNALSSATYPYYWNEIYQYIYMANAVLEGLTASSSISSKIKQQLTGEAEFIRAFLYFYAVNLYGDVPLALTTDYRVNNVIKRTPRDQVYQQIIQDLKDAKNSLSDDFLSPLGAITTERVRPNKGAATSLLARVYLYTKDWVNAEAEATEVISNTSNYKIDSSLNDVFLANSPEAIWQLQPVNPGFNTYDGYHFVLTSTPNSTQPTVLSDILLNSFETDDHRFTNWVGNYTDGSETYYYANKYKIYVNDPTLPVTEYLMVLRLAEQYLIRAEANAQLGKISEAQSDLNVIRSRAGLKNTSASTQADLLTAISHERQVELFTEWGHRWFDLKRTETINAIMSIVTPQKGGEWSSNWQLCPIPKSEISINPNLTQNAGY